MLIRDVEPRLADSMIERYYPAIFNFARRKLGNHHDAEDAAQETFARAHRGLAGFGGRGQVSTWLFVVSRNTITDCLRRRRRSETCPLFPDEVECAAPGTEPDPLGEFRMEDAIDRLPPADRDLLLQVTQEKKSMRRIADESSESLYRVRRRLSGIMDALRASTSEIDD